VGRRLGKETGDLGAKLCLGRKKNVTIAIMDNEPANGWSNADHMVQVKKKHRRETLRPLALLGLRFSKTWGEKKHRGEPSDENGGWV